jgi:hypothetical protein
MAATRRRIYNTTAEIEVYASPFLKNRASKSVCGGKPLKNLEKCFTFLATKRLKESGICIFLYASRIKCLARSTRCLSFVHGTKSMTKLGTNLKVRFSTTPALFDTIYVHV